jgi:hypothetical protein
MNDDQIWQKKKLKEDEITKKNSLLKSSHLKEILIKIMRTISNK